MKLITKEKAKEKAAKQVPKKVPKNVIKELSKLIVEGFANDQKVITFVRDDSLNDVTWNNLGNLIMNAGYKVNEIVEVNDDKHFEGYKIFL